MALLDVYGVRAWDVSFLHQLFTTNLLFTPAVRCDALYVSFRVTWAVMAFISAPRV